MTNSSGWFANYETF